MRLIDADAVIDAIKDYGHNAIDAHRKMLDPVDDIISIIDIVVDAPFIEMGWWVNANKQLPNTDELVLVIVSGKPQENIEFIDAYEFATYNREEGWIVEAYPMWENPQISYWISLPEPPREDPYETN